MSALFLLINPVRLYTMQYKTVTATSSLMVWPFYATVGALSALLLWALVLPVRAQTPGEVLSFQEINNGVGGLAGSPLENRDNFGSGAAKIGDVDGDGVPDVLVGAPGDADGASNAGAAYVLFLNANGTVDTQQKISNEAGGLASGTLAEVDIFGIGATGVGDVDGDGVPDVLVGAPGDDDGASNAGAAYVLFLNADGTVDAQQKISNGTGGLPSGLLEENDFFGIGSTKLGDIDGDGVPDVLVGAVEDDDGASNAGAAYVLFLNADGTVDTQQKISNEAGGLAPGTLADGDFFGNGAAGLGDIDGDGVPDVLVGAYGDEDGASNSGAAYVLFLNADGTVDAQQKISNEAGGLPSGLLEENDAFGIDATGLGDIDGDGVPDVLVGATQDDDGGINVGAAYVLFLNADGTVNTQQKISNGNGGLSGSTIADGDEFGRGAAGLGDVDGDGVPDVLVGARRDDDGLLNSGTAYVLSLDGSPTCVSGPGLLSYGATGVTIDFAPGTTGPGACLVVSPFDDPPTDTDGLPAGDNVSSYRIVITADAGLTVGPGTQVRFDVSQFGGITAPGDVTVYSRPDVGTGPFTDVPTAVETNDGVTELVATVDGFSEFVFVSTSGPLPVELSAFDATLNDEDAVLVWETLSETGNAGFEVQRAAGSVNESVETSHWGVSTGESWQTIATLDGAGTTDTPQSYQFTDTDLPYAVDSLSYRLRQIDTDGTESFSEAITVARPVQATELLPTYPNPVRSQATVRFAVPERQDVRIDLYDLMGRRIRTVVDTNVEGRTEAQLDVSDLASGTYFLRMQTKGHTETQRITVVR
ncbi:hypothetical protein CRI93_02850 [Longimonas halophila]|uniref:Secretion system C-terminal sorting domain-containing protein n=1 Tax=Longimonas halophila TaxID=1469170 RepID=A0A2H3NNU4_9BACT|nr:T9SS type A sorting domain-containing protein [Longimonas halophila]PEN08714.1 hypothetical protein CRI93_02850 [Longimonas halophila]